MFFKGRLTKLVRDKGFLAYIVRHGDAVVGYFFQRSFFWGKAFRGYITDYRWRRRGINKLMNECATEISEFLGLQVFGTIAPENIASLKSAESANEVKTNELKAHSIPAGGLEAWTWLGDVDKAVAQKFGITGKIIKEENAGRLYLDHEVIRQAGKTLDEVKQAVINEIEKRNEILYVVDYDNALTTSIPQPIRERIVNGYNKKRSGDLFYVAKGGWENVSNKPDYVGTTHGQWNPYDSHIPFLLYGWHVSHGQTSEPANITDITPTICAMLHIQMPNSCVGNAKEMK